MRYLNHRREGAPWVSLFGMCLSGALSDGAWKIMNYLAKRKFPTPPSGYDNPEGTLSYQPARSRWADMWLRIIMRTMFDAVAKPITSGIELCRAMAPTALSMDHATEADEMEPTRALQIPRWESCDHIAGMIPRFRNIYPPTVSQNRSRPLLNNSGHCLEKGTGSRSGVEDTTIPDTLVTSISTNAILSTSIHNRTRLISTNSSHCKENRTGSHLEK